MQLLRRGGRAFLLLPRAPRLAATSLELFPAQSARARLAKSLLGLALRAGLRPGLQPVNWRTASGDPFSRFLAGAAGIPGIPPFAMLAGNPRTDGQRCIFLLFNSQQIPVAVVKAGAGPAACELVEHEERFLSSVNPKLPGIPRLHSTFREGAVRAFAMEYCAGKSPRSESPELERILSSWLAQDCTVPLADLPPIRNSPLRSALLETLKVGTREVCPALYHGDFAPWNIKAERTGSWTALDWERGELEGVPLWDWLHFVVQPLILVKHVSAEGVLRQLEELIASADVQRYVTKAKSVGIERELTLLYLEHCIQVLRPTEGLVQLQELADGVRQTWFRH